MSAISRGNKTPVWRRSSFLALLILFQTMIGHASAFVTPLPVPQSTLQQQNVLFAAVQGDGNDSKSSSNLKPLYDGTNYTFPDSTTPEGIAELLEVSFVKACLQLASGYVDVLKLFIATAVAGYEAGFALADLQDALYKCEIQTANRPLMEEEEKLRYQWLCLVYLTCEAMGHPIKSSSGDMGMTTASLKSIRKDYGPYLERIAIAFQAEKPIPSVDELLASNEGSASLTQIGQAILQQSLRVATLTPVVIEEAKEANRDSATAPVDPPKPPIEGAF